MICCFCSLIRDADRAVALGCSCCSGGGRSIDPGTVSKPAAISSFASKYLCLLLIAVAFPVLGFAVQPVDQVFSGLVQIIITPSVLITDYIAVGGIGAAFLNAGLLMLASLTMLYVLKVEIGGLSVASVFLMGSFGLFGKSILNIWPIILGVYLYSRLRKQPFQDYVHTALLTTSIAPIVTELLFAVDLPVVVRVISSIAVGMGIGLLIAPLSVNVLKLHRGFNLYNIGFSVGILGTLFVSVFKSYGYKAYSKMVWSTGNDLLLAIFLLVLFLSMIGAAVLMDKRAAVQSFRLWKRPGMLYSDFIEMEGFPAALFNMGLNGILASCYVLAVGGPLNGPTIGGIMTVSGFGALGKHPRNILPIFIGVFLGGLTKTWSISDPSILIAALFGTSLAPIAGYYGWVWGVVAGYINSSVVLHSGILHGGMNLYNTGFSSGIVAAALYPILNAFIKKESI